MPEYLVLTLVAPMGSFGGPAGHKKRGSNSWPSRSAILGLIGAAMGIQREDKAKQEDLRNWRMAVSVLSDSVPLQDFHTTQTVPDTRIKNPATRRLALESLKPKDHPVVIQRDYRCDCVFGVALWGGPDMDMLLAALERPSFVPYLGRKSCPLAAPMAPHQVAAENVEKALENVTPPPWLSPLQPLLIASDDELPGGWQETLWDEPLDRSKWHFGLRTVHVSTPRGNA